MKILDDLVTSRRDALKGAASLAVLGRSAAIPGAVAATAVATAAARAQAQNAPSSVTITEPATGIVMHPGYARTIAQTAYVWGWPMVNMINRNARITQARTPGA